MTDHSTPSPAVGTSEMIEKVAEAIENQMMTSDNYPEDLARAAIKAMREPTASMLQAAWSELVIPPANAADMTREDLYKFATAARHGVMIDAALSAAKGEA